MGAHGEARLRGDALLHRCIAWSTSVPRAGGLECRSRWGHEEINEREEQPQGRKGRKGKATISRLWSLAPLAPLRLLSFPHSCAWSLLPGRSAGPRNPLNSEYVRSSTWRVATRSSIRFRCPEPEPPNTPSIGALSGACAAAVRPPRTPSSWRAPAGSARRPAGLHTRTHPSSYPRSHRRAASARSPALYPERTGVLFERLQS
jgi:hypothetical protein